MKFKRTLYLLVMLLWPVFTYADSQMQLLFNKGNEAYAKGQYKEAIADYEQILHAGYQSAAVYFNLGNASYKNGDIASAILYYEKAHKLSPGDDDISFNIQFANLKTTDKIDAAPQFFLERWWQNFILMFSGTAIAVWSMLLMLAASATLIVYFFTHSVTIKRSSFYTSIALFLIALFSIFVNSQQANYFDTHHQAVIFSSSVTVKGSPSAKAKALFVIHEGTKVDVLETNSSWTKIRLPNGSEGWIDVNDAKEI
jgi:tetratricopeptide (TPR) repeat protein